MNEVIVLENHEAHARAYYLRDDTKARLSVIEENYYAVCKNMKEMRDGKLYKELGYQNFEDCCNAEFGIKKVRAYKYISIAKRLPEDFVQSTVRIGTERTYTVDYYCTYTISAADGTIIDKNIEGTV